MTDLQELANKAVKFRNKRKWKKFHSPKNEAIALLIEATEFLEIFNYSLNDKVPENKKRHLEEELMDVLYWVLVIAHDNKINIPKSFARKMKKNKIKYPIELK